MSVLAEVTSTYPRNGWTQLPPGPSTMSPALHIVRFQSRAESFQPRNKNGSWVASSHAGGASPGGVWDSYLSMDLKIHEDVQGNVFVKVSRLSRARQMEFTRCTECCWRLADRMLSKWRSVHMPLSQRFRYATGAVAVHPSLPVVECS